MEKLIFTGARTKMKNRKLFLNFLIVLFSVIFFYFIINNSNSRQVEENVNIFNTVHYPNPQIWSLNRAPKFEDFKVEKIFDGQPAEVNIYSSPSAREFRGALRYAAKDGSNFAGHYTIASWGCGSSCQDGMIIDAVSGKVYDPFTEATSRGMDFRTDSYLVITDPFDDSFVEDIYRIPARYYIWKNNQFLQIYQEESP